MTILNAARPLPLRRASVPHPRWMRRCASLLLVVLAAPPATAASDDSGALSGEAIIGVSEAQLSADYWIEKARRVDRLVLDGAAIATQNIAMQTTDPSLHDIEALPDMLEREQVEAWISAISVRPTRTLYDETGNTGSERALDRLVNALDLRRIPQTQVTRYGMVVRRAALRTFPTDLRVFSSADDRNLDRFQESALFPGTPVVVVHESRDREWLFVVSQTYAAWIDKDAVAFGDKAEIFAHGRRAPYVVVTGATVSTVHARHEPRASEVQLDMGVRMPLLRTLPEDGLVNGQHPYFGHAIELPVRNEDGTLAFVPALIPRSADVSTDYLPMTRANILRQAFKFLGERYGWGHSFNARDCSGFVSEVLRSFGLVIPRNTGAQASSPALGGTVVEPGMGHEERLRLLAQAGVGDLLYVPGHVMMVIGRVDGATWVIHDAASVSMVADDGQFVRYPVNGVVVTPLLPLMADPVTAMVDRVTAIRRLQP